MKPIVASFLKSAMAAFAILSVLAFTPFSWLPMFLSLAFLGWFGIALVLAGAGAPFAGYLFTILFSQKGERLSEVASLSGLWVGALTGSWVGLELAGMSPWI